MLFVLTAGILSLVAAYSAGPGTPTGTIAALEVAATADDQLPPYVLRQGLDVESVRKVAVSDGLTYFLAEGVDEGTCVIRIKPGEATAWVTSCGVGAGRIASTSAPGISGTLRDVTLVADDYPTEDLQQHGWTYIHPNLLTRPHE